ncbi:MAG: aminodeoxychorismate/anthranilate synthase component II [Bacteroidetes bacterium 4572_77]|nr:MAG: aminodeoxychorismate/anthranilate synthase component II [Bacteroidetes bacterium 4572_77]
MPSLLILDNYDSFTYNLVQLVEQHAGWHFEVHKNDEFPLAEVARFDKILLSPGPGLPAEAGIMPQIFQKYASEKSILGICLGHHALAEAFGGRLFNFKKPVHGIQRKTHVLAPDVLFKNLPPTFEAGLYHSWAVEKESIPKELKITAISEKGVIMALQHKSYDVRSLQFHPESIMTPYGREMLWNWLS